MHVGAPSGRREPLVGDGRFAEIEKNRKALVLERPALRLVKISRFDAAGLQRLRQHRRVADDHDRHFISVGF